MYHFSDMKEIFSNRIQSICIILIIYLSAISEMSQWWHKWDKSKNGCILAGNNGNG